MISEKIAIFDKMDVLQHNLAGAQSCYVQSTSKFARQPLEKIWYVHQCKLVWSTNMTCPENTMVVRTYQVCALTMFALSQNFRVIVLEHKPSIYGNYFQKLHCIRLGYNSINHVL